METTLEEEEWVGIPRKTQITQETVLKAMSHPRPTHLRPSRDNHFLLALRAEVWGWCCPAEGQ